MAKYFITYNLNNEDDAAPLEAQLESIGAKKLLQTVWHVDLQTGKSQEVKDSLAKHTAPDERLMIKRGF